MSISGRINKIEASLGSNSREESERARSLRLECARRVRALNAQLGLDANDDRDWREARELLGYPATGPLPSVEDYRVVLDFIAAKAPRRDIPEERAVVVDRDEAALRKRLRKLAQPAQAREPMDYTAFLYGGRDE
jgi:hypothetical protein